MKLWTPKKKLEKASYVPPLFAGRVRLSVDYPDGENVLDTGWEKNTVLPYVPFMLWSLLNPYNSNPGVEYTDGTLYHASWNDILYSSPGASTTSYFTNSNATGYYGGSAGPLLDIVTMLMSGLVIGNYTNPAPTGNVTHINGANWTTYSQVHTNIMKAAGSVIQTPLGYNNGSYYGPAVTTRTISGVGPPTAQTTISYQFAAAAGTVNAIMFLPFVPNAGTGLYAGTVYTPTSYLVPFGTAPTANAPGYTPRPAWAAVGTTSAQFGTNNVTASTLYLSSSATLIPAGAQLTFSYTLSVTL